MTTLRVPSRVYWPTFLTYTILLYILFTLPSDKLPESLYHAPGGFLHFLDFFLLTLLAFQAFFYSRNLFFQRSAGTKAVSFSLFYGAFLEWAQLGVPGRTGTFEDWLTDALGVLVASGVFSISRLTGSS